MSHNGPGRYTADQTALLAVVAGVEPLVERWRRRFDASASAGIPAHVTVLYPFLAGDRVTSAVIDELSTVIGGHSPFAVRFSECRRFPAVLYLAPVPAQPFRALTDCIVARWPETPPYGGQFTEVVPHLIVAHDQPPEVLGEVEAALASRLPATAAVSSVSLFGTDGERWRQRAEFPLLGQSRPSDGADA